MRLRAHILAAAIVVAATAGARAEPRATPANMPAGWAWPPTTAMKTAGARCLARLDALKVAYERAPDTRVVATPIYVPSLELGGIQLESIWRKPPFVMDCHLAAALAAAAPELRALGIRKLRFAGIYDYRNIRVGGREKNILSRHALALAVDVYEVVTADGTKAVVKRDYRDSAVLHELEQLVNGLESFRTVLSPANDPRSHSDHFHIEARMPLK